MCDFGDFIWFQQKYNIELHTNGINGTNINKYLYEWKQYNCAHELVV